MVIADIMEVPLRTDEHGVIRVGNTRVTFLSVMNAYRRGETPEQIAQDYDALSLSQIYGTIAYYLQHKAELDDYLGDQRRGAADAHAQHAFAVDEIRERLARRK